MNIHEIAGYGFDASTDATDDRILWVAAESRATVQTLIQGTGATYLGPVPSGGSGSDIDFTLPTNSSALRAKLLGWLPTANTIYARADHVICPHCQGEVEGWQCDPKGLATTCDHCDKEFRVHPDADVELT